jgi:hypothetical protein
MIQALILIVLLIGWLVSCLLILKKLTTPSKQGQTQQQKEPFLIYTYRDEDFNLKDRFKLDCPVANYKQRTVDIDSETKLTCCVYDGDKDQVDFNRCNYESWCSQFCEDKSAGLVAMCVQDKSLNVCQATKKLTPDEFLKNEWTLICQQKYQDNESIQQCVRIGVASKRLPGSSVKPQTQRQCTSTITTDCINPGVL